MSEDSFTEVTQESWTSRIGGAFKGILVGLVLFVLAFPLLFWNEGRTVKQYKTLMEGVGAVVSVSSAQVDAGKEGRLIHMTGKADTEATLKDPLFGISGKALKLKRTVEMYQWEESSKSKSEKKVGGGTETVTTYTYNKTWSDKPIKSANFREPANHRNPDSFPYESAEQVAPKATLGAYVLSSSLVGKMSNFTALPVSGDLRLPPSLKGKAKEFDGGLYIGNDPASPQIGEMRVKFQTIQPGEVSIVARQVGNTFEPYRTKVGGTIELLHPGVVTADAMFQEEQESNKILAWVLRLAGFIVMLIGLNLIFRPLSVLGDVLPILGNILGAGTGIISFLLAAVLSLITVSIAWIFYRPLLGLSLLAVSAGLTATIMIKVKAAKKTV